MPDANSPLSLPSNIHIEEQAEGSNLHLPQNIPPQNSKVVPLDQGGPINLPAHMQPSTTPVVENPLPQHHMLDGFTASAVSSNMHQHGTYGLAVVGGGILVLTIFAVAVIFVLRGISSRRYRSRETQKINKRNDFIIQNQGFLK